MARTFVSPNGQYLENLTGIVTALPVTFACWFKAVDITSRHALISVGQGSNSNDLWELAARGDRGGDPISVLQASNSPTAASLSDSSGGYTANTWTHAAGVLLSNTSRTAYRDGVAGTTDTTSISSPSITLNRIALGCDEVASRSNFLGGSMAEAAVWSAALDAAEIAALAKGVCPQLVRPQSLVAYWPLDGNNSPELDRWRSKFNLTLSGTSGTPTKSDHPRIYYPGGPQ